MSITGSNNPFACDPVVFANANSIVSLGTITRDGNQFTFSVGFVWKINGVTYQNTAPVVLTIAEASEGFNRIDNALLNTSNTIELQQGLESETIALRPVAPETNIILTSWNISGTTIGDTAPSIVGVEFKKKIENTRYKSTLSGENVIIPFQAAGQSHYSVTNTTLVSVAGFTTAGLTTPMYEGQDVIFENQTGHDITLKDSFGVDTSFVIGADLVVPNDGKIWFRFRNNELELIDKNWFGIQEVVTSENLGEFIDGLGSKTDIKDDDEFIISDSEDSLKSKKTRFLDLKTKLKSYFDTFYLSLSIFNDFVEDVFSSLDNKLDKSSTPSSVYTTDSEGLQVMKPISDFQTPVGDYVTVNTTQTVTGAKTFNNVPLIKKTNTAVYPNVSGGVYIIGPNGSYDTFDFYSFDGTDQDSFGSVQIYSNPEEGNTIYHNSLDNQYTSNLNVKKFDLSLVNLYAGQRTTLFVDGQKKKIIIEGTQNNFAALGTNLITGTKTFEFPNNSGTLALLSDLTATQTALDLKENVANKATDLLSPNDTKYPTTLAVVNENKKATITVELINQLTTDFYAPNALRINSTALISGSGTITLKVNDIAYTIGNLIPQGAKITAETTSASVYNLISVYE